MRSIGASSGQNAAPPSPATRPTGDVRIGEVGRLRHQHHVAQHRDAAAQADGRAVHRGDHRQREPQHLVDDLGALAEALVAGDRVVEERRDPVQVTAGGERPARAGEDHHRGVGVGGELPPHVGERPVQVLVDGVERVGPVDGHDPDRAVGLDGQRVRQVVVHRMRRPRRRRTGRSGRAGRSGGSARRWVAGEPEREPPQRLAVPRDPRQRRLVAEPDRAVELVRAPGTRRPPPRSPPAAARARRRAPRACRPGDAPQRVLRQHLHAAALDLGVGELELHALERRRAAGRTARGRARSARVSSIARSSMPSSVQHGRTRPSARSPRPVVVERLAARGRRRMPTSAARRLGGRSPRLLRRPSR